MPLNRFHVVSPLALVAFSACRSPFPATSSVGGAVINGPLNQALVFLDYDFDGVLDANEPSARTDASGKYTLISTQNNYDLVAIADDQTVDSSSGATFSGITLKAPSGAGVISPTSTLMKEGGLTATEVAAVLGLPDDVDPLSFNPFADGVDAAKALEVAKVSKQITAALSSFASAAEGAGAKADDAFSAALKSVVDVVKTKAAKAKDPNASAADKKIDFTKTDDLELIKAKVATEAATLDNIDIAAMNALANDTRDAIKNVNDKIAEVTDLKSDATKNIFSATQVLRDQVKDAAVAQKKGEVANIAFKSKGAEFDAAMTNKAPQDINLTGDGTISENASSLVVGTVSTVDTDQDPGTAFKYKLAGKDADFFSLNERTGELSLVRKPDYAAKASYEVTIITEDSGGKKYAETFKISVVKAKAGEVYESSNAGNTTFLIADGTTSGKFDVIPVKIKSGGSGYEFDASKKTEAAYDVAADKLSESIGRDPTMKAVASTSDASAAEAAAKTALTPSVTITAFNDGSSTRPEYGVADGSTSKDGKLYLKFTLSDSSTDFTVDDITVTGGTLSEFTGSRTEYTAEFTPTGSSKVDTTINVAKDKFTNEYFGNTAATEFNWTYDPSGGGQKAGEVYESSNSGNTTFLIVDGATSGKFDVIPVKVKSGGSGYEFDVSKKTEVATDVAADKLSESIGRDPTKKADASNSDATTAVAAAKTALSPSVTITAFNNGSSTRSEYAVADGATSNDGKLYLKFTLSAPSTDFTAGDITVTGGTLGSTFTAVADTRGMEYTAEFTPSGSGKVATTINVAKDKFTNEYFGNTAATEFNWTFDPDNGLKDGDIVKETNRDGDLTGKFLLLDIEATDTPTKYTVVPVKKDGSNWVYESTNAASKAGGYGLSDIALISEVGPKPTGTGESVSDSAALTILKAAGVMVSIHGDEKGGSKAFSAGTHDASDNLSLSSPDSDGIGWIQKGVKAFGETTAANGVDVRGGKIDTDVFALLDLSSPTSTKLKAQEYKITIANEKWDGTGSNNDIADFKVTKATGGSTILNGANKFTPDGSSDYFLSIWGEADQDAQYSVILDLV